MTDIHTLAGAYVLDAVDDLERAAFGRHLAGCETCALEVAELRETAARLPDPTGPAPPPELRTAVLAAVSVTPQLRPGRADRSGRAAPARWRRWTAVAVAASVAVVGGAATSYLVQEQRLQQERDRVTAAQDRAARIEAVLTAVDATVHQEPAAGSGTVTVIGSELRDEAVVVLAGLPAPAAGQAYQLWLGTGAGMTSAGLLPAGDTSATALVTGLAGADLVGVSVEPAGGSPAPTQIVATIPLT